MKRVYHQVSTAIVLLILTATLAHSQVILPPSPYVQNFDGIGTGYPTGITARTGATATSLGTVPATLPGAMVAWNNTTGAVKNFASADGLTSTATAAEQNASADRALGIRQTGAFGDPGAAFVLQISNTIALRDFRLSFNLQSLDATSPRTTIWRVDYGFGPSPSSFTQATAIGTLVTG